MRIEVNQYNQIVLKPDSPFEVHLLEKILEKPKMFACPMGLVLEEKK